MIYDHNYIAELWGEVLVSSKRTLSYLGVLIITLDINCFGFFLSDSPSIVIAMGFLLQNEKPMPAFETRCRCWVPVPALGACAIGCVHFENRVWLRGTGAGLGDGFGYFQPLLGDD